MGPGTPPEVPEGWSVGPPDFVGVGAQKAGTSWWAALIHEHPNVKRTGGVAKELHFFDRYWESGFGASDIALYASYFPRPGGALAGEWTPGYMIDFWAPELIARAAPETRVLVLLRENGTARASELAQRLLDEEVGPVPARLRRLTELFELAGMKRSEARIAEGGGDRARRHRLVERIDGPNRANASSEIAFTCLQRHEGAGRTAEDVVEVIGLPFRSAPADDGSDRLSGDGEERFPMVVGEVEHG